MIIIDKIMDKTNSIRYCLQAHLIHEISERYQRSPLPIMGFSLLSPPCQAKIRIRIRIIIRIIIMMMIIILIRIIIITIIITIVIIMIIIMTIADRAARAAA